MLSWLINKNPVVSEVLNEKHLLLLLNLGLMLGKVHRAIKNVYISRSLYKHRFYVGKINLCRYTKKKGIGYFKSSWKHSGIDVRNLCWTSGHCPVTWWQERGKHCYCRKYCYHYYFLSHQKVNVEFGSLEVLWDIIIIILIFIFTFPKSFKLHSNCK